MSPSIRGASNATEYLPEDTFLDYREFGHLDHLQEYFTSMSRGEYEQHLAAIEVFLESGTESVRADNVAESIADEIREHVESSSVDPIAEAEFVRELEAKYASSGVTTGRFLGEAVEAFVDPPADLSRLSVASKVARAGYEHVLS